MGRALGYRDAIMLLGGDPPSVAALDRALGGALYLATGGVSDVGLNVFGAQGRIIRLGRELAAGLRDRVRGATRVDRTRRLEGAHTVVVVTAYFEALEEVTLPFAVRDLRLTREDQLRLAAPSEPARELLDALLTVAPPRPAPHLSYERFLHELELWYRQLSSRLIAFTRGLVVWDQLHDTDRAAAERVLGDDLCREALGRFQELYSQLAIEVPEFGFWAGQFEHQATRAEVRYALAGVESLLTSLSSATAPVGTGRALSNAYRATLRRPILSNDDPLGAHLPTLEEGYVDPDFRVRAVTGGDRPADEAWWVDSALRSDLSEYLVGALTSPTAALAPMVVLGQPGAGKSVLTKVLAARLPATDFVPVRVVLREVPAEAEIQDQIEYAIRATTGERTQWPDLARATGGALPVILLDGFDELLQATGVSQSDYLLKVARFQQREADQGRPVAAIVTSRTAVADRARYPEGAVALRLEPFRSEQINDWLNRWNRHNANYLRGKGLAPLPVDVVTRHMALASQPLLLLMLALYDAEANSLQHRNGDDEGRPLDETALYEQLLTMFAAREVNKSAMALPADQVAALVEAELQRLSLVAFAMINRRRQWVTEAELEADLVALLGRRTDAPGDFRAPLTQADLTLGRFFYIQRAQAMRDGSRLQTYEFLHATFGEYLAARLAVQLAAGLLAQRPALTVGPTRVDDDLLYALLSFAPLSSRQQLRFVRGCAARQVAAVDHQRLGGLLIEVLDDSAGRIEHRHAGYRPATIKVSSRHGRYGANLVLLILVFTPVITASRLFRDSPDPAGTWNRRVLLWRSALYEPEWTDLALALTVRYTWNTRNRDLEIRLTSGPIQPPDPIDLYWHTRIRPEDERRGNHLWSRSYINEVIHKMAVVGGANDSIIRHAIDPLVNSINDTVMTFLGQGDGPATSVAHDLLNLWLTSTLGATDEALVAVYRRCGQLLNALATWNREIPSVVPIVLSQLRSDAERVPADIVIDCLTKVSRSDEDKGHDPRTLRLTLECALAALAAEPSDQQRAELIRIAARAAARMRNVSPPSDLLSAGLSVHASGLGFHILGEQPEQFLAELLSTAAAKIPKHLLKRATRLVATTYPQLANDPPPSDAD